MRRLTLVYNDLTHGGAMDADLVLALFCALFLGAAVIILARSLWMLRREDIELERAVERLEDDR